MLPNQVSGVKLIRTASTATPLAGHLRILGLDYSTFHQSIGLPHVRHCLCTYWRETSALALPDPNRDNIDSI